MKASKKKLITASLAVMLAMALIGGSIAYLTGESEKVTNTFNPNTNSVDVSESTGDEYEIIPGTEVSKDPVVTVNTTVDSYVYLVVTDTTGGLVDYDIITSVDNDPTNGWVLLPDSATTETYYDTDSNVQVYYRIVSGSDAAQYFDVLVDNTVSYSADLTNEQMETGATLSFKAYIHQIAKEGSQDIDEDTGLSGVTNFTAVEAYEELIATVSTVDDLNTAISAGKDAVVSSAITTSTSIAITGEDTDITLYLTDGASVTSNTQGQHTLTVNDGATLEVIGGTLDATAHATAAVYNDVDSTVTLSGVTVTRSEEAGASSSNNGGNSYYAILNHGTMTLNNCDVTADGSYSSLIENGWQNGSQNTTAAASTLTINGGSYVGGLNCIKNDDYGVLVINSGTFAPADGAQFALMNWNVATINGGVFTSTGSAVIYNAYADATMDKGELTITGGTFGAGKTYGIRNISGTVTISGGTFSFEPDSSYLLNGYVLVENDNNTWSCVTE